MLSSIAIENFKSYRRAELELAPLTVLIGANASGKSNAIEALRLLSWVAQGRVLGDIRRDIQENDRAVRGSVMRLGFENAPAFSLSCRTTHEEWDRYSVTLRRTADDNLHVEWEELGGERQNVPLFKVVASRETTGNIWVAYNNFARGGNKPEVVCADNMAVLSQFQSPARFGASHKRSAREIPGVCNLYRNWLSNILFLDPRPREMRGYAYETDKSLASDGANLSGVLHGLCEDRNMKAVLLEFVESLPEQNIADIAFVRTERGEVMVKLTETFGGKNVAYDASLLSDGTLRVLAIAAAALSAPEGSLVVIEEIDNGVHPNRIGRMLKRLADLAEERGIRILMTSHNPALLDALPLDAIPNAVFCYRDPDDGSSRLTRLEDIPRYPELIAQGTLGRLATRGIMERFAKDRLAPEERRRRAHAWLAELQKQVG